MSDVIRARDLMRTEFCRIRDDQGLGEAMDALRQTQQQDDMPDALMVVDANDRFQGMLTAKLLIRILIGNSDAGGEADDVMLLEVAQERLRTSVGDALILDVPVVAPDDRLLTMIRRGCETRLDFVPVVDQGCPVGLAPITAIFQAAAAMALTPEHEGIRFDR